MKNYKCKNCSYEFNESDIVGAGHIEVPLGQLLSAQKIKLPAFFYCPGCDVAIDINKLRQ